MSRTRSPGYPNFSLREAVKRAERIHKADRRNIIDRENAAIHMGYSGISGAADKALATMAHYGLLERKGKGEVCITQAAVDILHPVSEASRKAALRKAAFRPELFATLRTKFPDGASEGTLKSFLIRENFLDRAIAPAISAYEDTCSFLKQEGAYESDGQGDSEEGESSTVEFEEPEMDAVIDTPKPQIASAPQRLPETAPAPAELGTRRFVINLPDGGDATLTYPADLTAEGYQDLQDYLDLFFKKAKRSTGKARDDFSDLC